MRMKLFKRNHSTYDFMNDLIEGVKIKNIKVIPDERGWFMEILRNDDEIFQNFGQIYITTAYPGVVKGWHCHKKQTDNFTCIHGMVKVVLYDAREKSKTFGKIIEFIIGEKNPFLISVPPRIYHGFKCIGIETAYFLNLPNLSYNDQEPDEYRLPPNTNKIPYDWGIKHR